MFANLAEIATSARMEVAIHLFSGKETFLHQDAGPSNMAFAHSTFNGRRREEDEEYNLVGDELDIRNRQQIPQVISHTSRQRLID